MTVLKSYNGYVISRREIEFRLHAFMAFKIAGSV